MRILIFFIPLFVFSSTFSQVTNFNFRRLSTSEGLSDGIVRAFTQDQYGYIWIGTSYGLNRFDGASFKNFFYKPSDSTSLIDNLVQSLYCDSRHNLWVGTNHGLCRYDYSSNKFLRYGTTTPTINDIKEDKKGRIWLGTNYGLWTIDEQNHRIQKFSAPPELSKKFQTPIRQIAESKDGNWYMSTNEGIKIFNPLTNYYSEIRHDASQKFSLSGENVQSTSMDSSGNLWAICFSGKSLLNKIDLKNHTVKYYDRFLTSQKKWNDNNLNKVLTDKKGRVWMVASASGLSLYNERTDDFTDYTNDPFLQNSLVADHNLALYQDREGIIWIGSAGHGCSYFDPDKNLFSTIYSQVQMGNSIAETWCRAVCEDHNGNLWMGTGRGVIRYNPGLRSFKTFTNADQKNPVLCSNSVRSLLEDDIGDIWIGTAKGLNRYHPSTGIMDSFSAKQGIPAAFFWMMAEDKHGGVWMGTTWGLYKYIREQNRFDDLKKDSLLSKFAYQNVQALYVDSHNRIWIGLMDVGLVMYDIDQKKIRLLTIRDSLISDTRFSSFAEDRNGIIWIGSEQGLVAYDPIKNCSQFFTRESGLPSDRTNNLMVDSFNRVWIGTSNGLCVLNADRKKIKRFDVNDGLITNQFNEQAACRTHSGLFIFPTYKGFTVFHPEDYRDNTATVPVYITSLKISNKEITTNTEVLQKIKLGPDQNFFSITLAGLNYMNPNECTFAYKLEPFDKEWTYTSKRELNYTNVPSGDYTFRYKVITDNADWSVPEKTLQISVAEVFYKTWWFKTLLIAVFAVAVVAFYRYRFKQREKIVVLENKAQLLEKEKTIVQYDNLKQQLNPHFLFNSLTSLRSLIRVEPATATHFLDGLSKTYRYLLKSGDNEMVSLAQELNFVETFSDLQKTRFKEGLQIHVDVDDSYHNKFIVPATLQNLIENAIKHNTAGEESPLVIDIYTENDYIVVKNNLQRYRIVETSNKRGLASLSSLYRFLSDKAVVVIENENSFIVKIPLI